jgi:hypothetical protein
MGAVSCFGFVGPVGLAYAAKLLGDGFGLSRPVPHPKHAYLGASERRTLGPDASTLTLAQRVDTAEGALRGMGLTESFAPLVLLAGHGSTTVNNPHATGLDCGACGGHTGEANARVAVAVLNDPSVRAARSQAQGAGAAELPGHAGIAARHTVRTSPLSRAGRGSLTADGHA